MAMEKAFGAADWHLIDSFRPVVDALAALFGEGCEVVLHGFDSPARSVVYIANGHITGRQVGAPATDFALSRLQQQAGSCWSSYFARSPDGKLMKCASITLHNAARRPIGMLCINLNLDAPLSSLLGALSLPVSESGAAPLFQESFAPSLEDLVAQVISQVAAAPDLSAARRNRQIISALYDKGIFTIKEAINLVAERLGVSRHTVYLHIRNHKARLAEAQESAHE